VELSHKCAKMAERLMIEKAYQKNEGATERVFKPGNRIL
jgi:hypothetical protein